jgi:ABC-type Zn uptake system ZnuABC Zn-binding protein ZnuA
MAFRRLLVLFLLAFLIVGAPLSSAQDAPLSVVATYSILGDLVANVGGERIALTVLVGADSDPHVYEPTPQDAIALARADLIFENGLEFETWLDDLYASSGSTAARVVVSEGIEPIPFGEHGHEHDHDHGGFMEGAAMQAARLIVNDYESGKVHVIDLRSNEVIATFELTARAALYPSEDGRYAFAVQTGGNITQVVDSGVSAVPHDDHFHTEFGRPALLGVEIPGSTPIHYVAHHGMIALFNDGAGSASIFSQDYLFDPSAEIVTLTTARPHHGVAVPLDDVVLISSPNMDDMNSSLPIGVDVMNLAGEILQSFPECPGLHGEASYSRDGVAFGCSDGILLIERSGGEFVSRKIANPTDNPDLRTGTLYYTEGAPYLLGNYGRNAIVRIDPAAGTSEIVIDAGQRIWRFQYHGEDPSKVVALTMDGNLHVIDIASGAIEGTVQVVDPFLAPGQGRAAARPTFVTVGHMAYVSEPLPGDIRAVDLETMEIVEGRIFVGGKPSSMAAFGMAAVSELSEHDHDHAGHAHEHGEFDPHIWHNPNNAVVMVENIRDALIAADPENAAFYTANAEAYIVELLALDAYIREQVATIPAENRILVTSHETFGYFAAEYGFEMLSVVGVTTNVTDPSAGALAELITALRESGAPAVFLENVTNPAVLERVAAEAGVRVADTLYTDALGQPGTPGETYLSMVRYNVDTIVEALR